MQFLKKTIDFVTEILETVVFIGSAFIVVYLFIMTPNQVKGTSMEPTFSSGDYILTSRVTYKFRNIERGDVIVFNAPKNVTRNYDIEYIKRIIGLPGDRILIANGEVYVNDQVMTENYISAKTNLWEAGCLREGIEYVVPSDEIFVMGDNRPRSSDSRDFCSVPIRSIVGTVFFRYFPPDKIGKIENPLPRSIR